MTARHQHRANENLELPALCTAPYCGKWNGQQWIEGVSLPIIVLSDGAQGLDWQVLLHVCSASQPCAFPALSWGAATPVHRLCLVSRASHLSRVHAACSAGSI